MRRARQRPSVAREVRVDSIPGPVFKGTVLVLGQVVMRQTWLAGLLATGLFGSTLPAEAAQVQIGSVSPTDRSGDGGISADRFARLLGILLEGLEKQQQRAPVLVPMGYEVTGITKTGMFGRAGDAFDRHPARPRRRAMLSRSDAARHAPSWRESR